MASTSSPPTEKNQDLTTHMNSGLRIKKSEIYFLSENFFFSIFARAGQHQKSWERMNRAAFYVSDILSPKD